MRKFFALMLLLPVLAACDNDPSTPAVDNSHVGVYQLQSAGGMAVPVTFEEDGETFTILGATLTLNGNQTFSMAAQLQITAEGQTVSETDALAGTYSRTGNSVTFTHTGGDVGFETATLSGDVLTTAGGDGSVLVFEK